MRFDQWVRRMLNRTDRRDGRRENENRAEMGRGVSSDDRSTADNAVETAGWLRFFKSNYRCSHLDLIEVNAAGTKKLETARYIINPYVQPYRTWAIFLHFLVVYSAWICLYEVGFVEVVKGDLAILDNAVNAFFLIDIILTFFVAYVDQSTGDVITEKRAIASRYIHSNLLNDILSTLPSELIRMVIPTEPFIVSLLSLVRLYRLRRIDIFFAGLEKDSNRNYVSVRCVRLIAITLFAAHFAACIFHVIGKKHAEKNGRSWLQEVPINSGVLYRYVLSLYWSITTLTTVGYGDYSPVSSEEMIFTIIYMIFNLSLGAYLIGNMTVLTVDRTRRTKEYRDNTDRAIKFAQKNGLTMECREQILNSMQMTYRADSVGFEYEDIIKNIPRALKKPILFSLFSEIVKKVYLFENVSEEFLFQLVAHLKPRYYPENEKVILFNEPPAEFYIINSGEVGLIADPNGTTYDEKLVDGDIIGEIGVLCNRPHQFTAKTMVMCKLLWMDRISFLDLIKTSIPDGSIILENLFEYMRKNRNKTVAENGLKYFKYLLGRGKSDLPLSLHFALNIRDYVLMQKLLKDGLNLNETGKNGVSILQTAVVTGDKDCLLLLLEHGADVNHCDIEGSCPLWEAIQKRDEDIISLLTDYGANFVNSENVSSYACKAIKYQNMELLEDIVKYSGDLSRHKGMSAPREMAMALGNVKFISFLIKSGVNPDIAATDELGSGKPDKRPIVVVSPPPSKHMTGTASGSRTYTETAMGKRPVTLSSSSTFDPSAASTSASAGPGIDWTGRRFYIRVIISYRDNQIIRSLVVLLPRSLEELLRIGGQKFGFHPIKVLTKEGFLIDDIKVIRDGDQLFLSDDR